MSDLFDRFQHWFRHPSLVKLAESKRPIALGPLPAAAQAFVLAALAAQKKKRRPRLVLAPGIKALEELASDLEAWQAAYLLFAPAEAGGSEALPGSDLRAERSAVLNRLEAGFSDLLLTTTIAADQPVPTPEDLRTARQTLTKNSRHNREALLAHWQNAGYTREAQVQSRGQFSVRGAVLDIFSWDATRPLRTEWEDDELISLREFDPDGQRSVQTLKSAEISLAAAEPATTPVAGARETATLRSYLPAGYQTIDLGPASPETPIEAEEHSGLPENLTFYAHDFLHAPRGDFVLQETRRHLLLEHLHEWLEEKWEIVIFCHNEGEQKRLEEILAENQVPLAEIRFVTRPLLRGLVWPAGRLVILSDSEIFGRYQTVRAQRQQERLVRMRGHHQALDFTEFAEGDYVVHLHQGIARFGGVVTLPAPEGGKKSGVEVLVLEFAEKSKLYVPLEQAYLVSKYVGVGRRHPTLDVLGGSRWERAKVSAQKAVMDYAAQLLQVQASRDSLQGFAFGPDTTWQREFEDSFVYEETEDQARAIVETKNDMEAPRPMDRLICGDVGFGKTEVAIRAIFKAIQEGRQAALLCPTTVLAEQHAKNLGERFAAYPFRVECLSRLRSPKEQRVTLRGLQDGSVDVVIGTHRLLSQDVKFAKLGLVVVDEEQRFGVKQKERFKQLFQLVDVLTLSATPIPRTLYLSLTGARDMSTIETAPPNRHPVETIVAPYDDRVIRAAIERELARNGQVYFLHNRIHSIQEVAQRLKELVPKARLEIGHGQMEPDELEEVMGRFVAGETDILLSTTIIESGLDIPNANTIIIDRADRFGLADLYQLRGRVGRAHHKAYAYLFLPRQLMGTGDARKRVSAIQQYSQLGAGFKIAMRDLEIRGAGNLLGTAQSGHITAVGFDLYCQLLKTAVARFKGEKPDRLIDTKLQLDFLVWQENEADEKQGKYGAYLPRRYLSESRWRIEGYRRLAEANKAADLETLRQEWRDRQGPWPPAVERLLLASELKIAAAAAGLAVIETQGEKLMLRQGHDYVMVSGKFPRLTKTEPAAKLHEIISWVISLKKPST